MNSGVKGLLKFVIIMSLIMGGLTVILLVLQNVRQNSNRTIEVDPDTMKLVQLETPNEGDPIAIVDTTVGEFKFVLYPQYSPNAVKNFTELAESGYYDNTYVFNSESGVYSAMGCPQKNGEMPQDYDQSRELVERELNQNLWPFKGAVISLNTTVDRSGLEWITGGGTYFNGSRFAVLNTIEFDDEMKNEMLENSVSRELAEAFIDLGGIPNFSQQMTVIGQTYEGTEVIEKLSQLETEENGIYKIPKEDIMINSVRISKYTENEN
ncbi:MAG: peptidylprolyl isomerase [Ruminococcus sp.]|nr:peptidylprolyl isomerase [Ruminococcus sp.]